MEYDLAIKRSELIHATTWMDCKGIILKKANLKRLHILHDSIYITFTNEKNTEVKKRLVVPGYGERNGSDYKGVYKDVSWW